MKNLLQCIILALLLIPSVIIAGYPDCPDTIRNSHNCAIYLENRLLQENNKLFLRQGNTLIIKLRNGKEKIYVDKDKDDHSKSFNFVKYFPEIDYGLVHVQYYEGDTYFIINLLNGKDKDIQGFPLLSPNKKRFAVYSKDLDAGYNPNILAVYRVGIDYLFLEFKEEPKEWGPSSLRWIQNDQISFKKDSYRIKEQKNLKYFGGKWRIE